MEQVIPQLNETLLIAVPSVEPGGMHAALAPHFGRCTCFTLARIENGMPQQIGIVQKAPNSGCQVSVSLLKAHGVHALLSQHIGLQPYNTCLQNGITVLATTCGTVADALTAYAQHAVTPMTTEEVCTAHSGQHHGAMGQGHHGHGSGQCGQQ